MLKVFKYSLFDMVRNRWMFFYMIFFLLISFAFLMLSNDLTQVLVSLNNIILAIAPLIGIIFGVIYYYNMKEFIELLLTQPLTRRSVFIGVYLGLAASLSISLILGVGIPAILFGVIGSKLLVSYLSLIGLSVALSIIFSLIGFLLGLKFDNKVKGFGTAICLWLFFALIYDGIFLILLIFFKAYPLEKLTIILSLLNPVGLARTLIIMQLDISAMMGFSGAVLKQFFGSSVGMLIITTCILAWILVPFWLMKKTALKKDF